MIHYFTLNTKTNLSFSLVIFLLLFKQFKALEY